jgi:hypothetical protein
MRRLAYDPDVVDIVSPSSLRFTVVPSSLSSRNRTLWLKSAFVVGVIIAEIFHFEDVKRVPRVPYCVIATLILVVFVFLVFLVCSNLLLSGKSF